VSRLGRNQFASGRINLLIDLRLPPIGRLSYSLLRASD
jgi:hypothetical protein